MTQYSTRRFHSHSTHCALTSSFDRTGQTGPLEDSLDDDVEAEKFAIDLTEDDDMDEEDTFEEFTYINPQMLNLFTNSMNMA